MFKELYQRDNEWIKPRPELLNQLAQKMHQEKMQMEKKRYHKKMKPVWIAAVIGLIGVSAAAAPYIRLDGLFREFFGSLSGIGQQKIEALDDSQKEIINKYAVAVNKSIEVRNAVLTVESVIANKNTLYMIYHVKMNKDSDSALWDAMSNFKTYGGEPNQNSFLGNMVTSRAQDEKDVYATTYYRIYTPEYALADKSFDKDSVTLVITDKGDYKAAAISLSEGYKKYGVQKAEDFNEPSPLKLPFGDEADCMSLNRIGFVGGKLRLRTAVRGWYQIEQPKVLLRNIVTGVIYSGSKETYFGTASQKETLYVEGEYAIADIGELKNLEIVVPKEYRLTFPVKNGNESAAYKIDIIKEKVKWGSQEICLKDIEVTPFSISVKSDRPVDLRRYISLRLKDGTSPAYFAYETQGDEGTYQHYLHFDKPVPPEMMDAVVIKSDNAGNIVIPLSKNKQ